MNYELGGIIEKGRNKGKQGKRFGEIYGNWGDNREMSGRRAGEGGENCWGK
jgi:hypothetical protein